MLIYDIEIIVLVKWQMPQTMLPYSRFFLRGPNFCEICELKLALQKAGRELYFQVLPVSQT